MECCICREEIEAQPISGWDQGNNAEPVVEDGRCCDRCNAYVVFPKRVSLIVNKTKAERHEVDLWEDLP